MSHTIESPFVSREIFGETPRYGGRQGLPGFLSTSPFVSAFMPENALVETDEDVYGDGEIESFADTDLEEALETERFDLLADEEEPFAAEFAETEGELDELGLDELDDEGYDPASNEGAIEMEMLEGDTESPFDSLAMDFDAELFQRLIPIGPMVEQALVSAQIAKGVRDVNALTDFVFFVRYPQLKGTRLGKGQEALMAEWRQIRDMVVAPALARATTTTPATVPAADTLLVPLGVLSCTRPGRAPFRYAFTSDDLLWTARFIIGEAGGRDDLQNRCVIWAMFNRYAFFRPEVPGWGSFAGFLKQYSTPLQPYLKKYEQVKRWVKNCNSTFDNKECKYQPTTSEMYPDTSVPKGQLKRFVKLQRTPWSELGAPARQLATLALSGGLPNPIGNATDFADTAVYYERKHGEPPTRAQWEAYTRSYVKDKFVWRPEKTPYDEFKNNVMFTRLRAKDYPPAQVSRAAGGSVAPAPSVSPVPVPPTPTAPSVAPTGDPDRELLYDGSTPAPGTVETRRSYPTNPPIKGGASNRNRMRYDNAINQFAVGVNPRYKHRLNKKGKVSTFCNIFCWDVTRAMGAEIPHWIDRNTGDPVAHTKGGELSANATFDWLHKHGGRYGWRQIPEMNAAQNLANEGHPTIAILKLPGIGHVSVIRPGEVTDKGAAMSQAGKRNVNHTRVYEIFSRKSKVEFWGSWPV